jgi:hypothetical protein
MDTSPIRARTPPAGRRGRIIGWCLLVSAFTIGPASVVVFATLLLGWGVGGTSPPWLAPLLLVGMLLSPALAVLGWLLAAGRKTLVLFLRRFGNEALNDAVRDLVQTRLRRRFRLITLDDSAFQPAGPRWSGLLVSLSAPGCILLGILLSYAGCAKVAQSELREETPFGEALVLIQIGMAGLAVLACLVCVTLAVIAVRAHFLSRRRIDGPRSRTRVVKKLRRLQWWIRAPSIAGPMATVVTTTDAEWQATVKTIVPLCEVVLLDISTPSESIGWELGVVLESGTRVILLAHRDRLRQWWKAEGGEEAGGRLRALAERLPMLVYDSPERLGETPLVAMLLQPVGGKNSVGQPRPSEVESGKGQTEASGRASDGEGPRAS